MSERHFIGASDKKHRLVIREFLNNPGFHSTAYVFATVERTKARDKFPASVSLSFSDCDRKINIELDMDSPEERANSLDKVARLKEAMIQLEQALEKECSLQDRREMKKKKKKKSKAC